MVGNYNMILEVQPHLFAVVPPRKSAECQRREGDAVAKMGDRMEGSGVLD